MKIYITLLLLLIVTSLVGCNTVVTKHSAEKTAQTYPVVNNTVHKSQESDFPVNVNLRIDEKSIDLALSYAEVQQDALFSTRWTSEDSQDKIRLPKNEERHLSIIQVSKVENASPKGKLVLTNQWHYHIKARLAYGNLYLPLENIMDSYKINGTMGDVTS